MPGIFGFIRQNETQNAPSFREQFPIHCEKLIHLRDEFDNGRIRNTIVYYDFQKDYPFHYDSEDLQIWIYGDPLIDGLTGKKAFQRTIEIILNSYPDISKLDKVDGLFNIILYDKVKNKLYLINDRNGLAHLYYGVFNNQLIWGSELRYFVNKSIKTTLCKESIYDFLNLGYLIKNDTWFEEVKLLPPTSYIEWDLNTCKLESIREYWSYKSLKRDSISKPNQIIINDLKELFYKAVEKRAGEDERIGITLSGGLDSRLIFANIPFQEKGFTAITRGMKNAGDIVLAKQVASLRTDCEHIIKDMNANNWFDGRKDAAIATSGLKNIFDMNAISSMPIHKKYFDINLDGAGGDGIFIGGHLNYEKVADLKEALKQTYFRNAKFNIEHSLDKLTNYYKEIDSDQYFYIHQRVRYYTVFGSILGHDYGIITRFPFLDNEVQEYIYQLSKDKAIGKLAVEMYLKYFPEYFKEIDSLNLGHPLSSNSKINLLYKVVSRLREKVGIPKYQRKYHNYSKWLSENNRELLDEHILNENLYLYKFIPYQDVKNITSGFLETGKNNAVISRLLSLSIFLENYTDTIQK